MKFIKKLVINAAAFAVIITAVHHATWYAMTFADYAFYITIMCIALCVMIVTVES